MFSFFTGISKHCHFHFSLFLSLPLKDDFHLLLEVKLLLLLEDELLNELLLLCLHLGQGSVLGGQPGSGNDFQKQQVYY